VIGPAAHAALLMWVWHAFSKTARAIFPGQFVSYILIYIALAVLGCLIAAHSLMMHLRWGRVAKTLIADSNSITTRWLGFRQMRERCWNSQDVKSIDLKSHKDVFTWKLTHRLIIRFNTGFRRQIVIPIRDQQLARQIHEVLLRVLVPKSSPGCLSRASISK
jgi:hypothetical protein